jgi:hypothetical protein
MARYDHLPIWKDAVALAALLEEVVRRFPRYHKYALGADLRRQAYAVGPWWWPTANGTGGWSRSSGWCWRWKN